MSAVLRIKTAAGHTVGWQARVYVAGQRYVSRYFACAAHGGNRKALALAHEALPELDRKARRLRAAVGAQRPADIRPHKLMQVRRPADFIRPKAASHT